MLFISLAAVASPVKVRTAYISDAARCIHPSKTYTNTHRHESTF